MAGGAVVAGAGHGDKSLFEFMFFKVRQQGIQQSTGVITVMGSVVQINHS
jgi:hypothetical protein